MFEDALKNSWAYQEIMQEGEQIGEQKRALAELRRQRRLLSSYVQMHFPRIVDMAKERGNTIDTSEVLDDLTLRIFAAKSEEEARRILSQ